jgi:hypothetical protein
MKMTFNVKYDFILDNSEQIKYEKLERNFATNVSSF